MHIGVGNATRRANVCGVFDLQRRNVCHIPMQFNIRHDMCDMPIEFFLQPKQKDPMPNTNHKRAQQLNVPRLQMRKRSDGNCVE
jgi:hypothetical protein